MNIRNEADRASIEAKGFSWVTVAQFGDGKGAVMSKHRSYEAASRAAAGRDLRIVALDQAAYF